MINKEPKVVGIGGISFKSKNPDKTKKWYEENLGVDSNDPKYGTIYKSRNIDNPDVINYFQWSPFNKNSDFYNHSKKEFMITYSVQNIEQLIQNIRRKGITIVDDIKEYKGIGKIVHIYDCDGNYCELWEQPN